MTLIYFLFLRHHTVGLMMIIVVLCITVLQSLLVFLSLTRVCRWQNFVILILWRNHISYAWSPLLTRLLLLGLLKRSVQLFINHRRLTQNKENEMVGDLLMITIMRVSSASVTKYSLNESHPLSQWKRGQTILYNRYILLSLSSRGDRRFQSINGWWHGAQNTHELSYRNHIKWRWKLWGGGK